MTNTIYYIAKRRELRDAAPERCCLTLTQIGSVYLIFLNLFSLVGGGGAPFICRFFYEKKKEERLI